MTGSLKHPSRLRPWSHNLCMEKARERLVELHEAYRLQQLVVINSVPQSEAFQSLPFLSIEDLAETLAWVINRIHHDRSVSELFQQTQ